MDRVEELRDLAGLERPDLGALGARCLDQGCDVAGHQAPAQSLIERVAQYGADVLDAAGRQPLGQLPVDQVLDV